MAKSGSIPYLHSRRATISEHEPRRAAAAGSKEPPWRQHLGLVVSGALTVFLVFKILAVAGWDSTTAMGIVAASGTANVLVGATFTILPTLYGFLILVALPEIQKRLELRQRNSAERAAVRMLETWPFVILTLIVPLYLVLGILLLTALQVGIKLMHRRRALRNLPPRRGGVSQFEANAVALAAAAWLIFASLGSPWLPAQIVSTSLGQPQTVYIINSQGDQTVVLLDAPRRLERFETRDMDLRYCEKSSHWIIRPPIQLASNPGYAPCSAEGE